MTMILGILLRHGLTALGAIMASKGIIGAGEVETFAGVGVAVLGGLISYIQKRRDLSK